MLKHSNPKQLLVLTLAGDDPWREVGVGAIAVLPAEPTEECCVLASSL